MIGKLSVLGFSLVTALSGSALAHDPHDTSHGHGHAGPGGYGPAGHGRQGPASYGGGGYRPAGPEPHVGYSSRIEVDLRYADLNRDGWVTMQEALDSGRQVFRRNDRNNDLVLSRWETGDGRVRRGDRNNDGRVTMHEYQRNVRARFASLDTNRDGFLARYELGLEPQRGSRSAGWWRGR
jgi:EF hand domain-containing protein